MKRLLFLLTAMVILSFVADAQKKKTYKSKSGYVKGYTTKKGKRVKGHTRKRSSIIIMEAIVERRKLA